jgi:hypothetical protein
VTRAVSFWKGFNRGPVVRLACDGAFEPNDLRTLVLDDCLSQSGFVLGKQICKVLEHPQGMRRECQGVLQGFTPVAARLGSTSTPSCSAASWSIDSS